MPELVMPKKRMNARTEMRTKLKDVRYKWPDKIWFEDKKTSTVGDIYLARIIIDGKNIRAIVKEIPLEKPGHLERGIWYDSFQTNLEEAFKKRKIKYTPENIAKAYNQTIIDLRAAGIPLPKMKAIVKEGKLLLISQYFGNNEKRKLTKHWKFKDLKKSELNEFIDLYVKSINSGYLPTPDFLERFSGTNQTGFVPLDIDQQVRFKLECTNIEEYVKNFVWRNSALFFKELGRVNSLKIIYAILRQTNSEELKKALYKAIREEYKIWFR